MTSVDSLTTLLDVFVNIFPDTHTHTDTKALLYPICACACRIIRTFLEYARVLLREISAILATYHERPSFCDVISVYYKHSQGT